MRARCAEILNARDATPDPRPGFYYVSAIDAGRSARLDGPYPTHAEALGEVERARAALVQMDPRAWFYAFGTCRSETDLGPGYLRALAEAEAGA